MKLRAWLRRCRDVFRRRHLVAAFDEEMAFHLEQLTRDYERRGLSPEAARRAARREFGNTTGAREAYREQAGWPELENWWRDLAFTARGLARRPLLTLGASGILALALGAALTLVVLVDAIFLRPLAVPHPGELYIVRDLDGQPILSSAGTARRLADLLPPGASLAAHSAEQRVTVQRGRDPAETASSQLVEGRFFGAIGLKPVAGRLLAPADDSVGAPADVVVVGEAWAESHFGTPATALNAELQVNRHPVRIIGVVPRSFTGLSVGSTTQLWLPAALQPVVRVQGNAMSAESDDRPNNPDWNREERVAWMHLLLRLPGNTKAGILARLRTAWAPERDDLLKVFDDPQQREALQRQQWRLDPAPGGYSHFRSEFGSTSRLLSGIVGALLLLAAANVSNLLLVRTLARHRELGVRLAMGASRARVRRLALLEAGLLGLLGAAVGSLLAAWMVPLAARLLVRGPDLTLRLLEWRPLVALAGMTGIAVLLCAWGPAAWISRLDPRIAIGSGGGPGRSPLRLGRFLVAAQLALAVVVVTVAVTLGRELQRTLARDPGFARTNVITANFNPTAAGFSGAEADALIRRLEARARAVPGVDMVGFAGNGILAGSEQRSGLFPRGDDVRVHSGHFQNDQVSDDYLAAVGMTVLRGRSFTSADSGEAPHVAVVTETFAREVYGTPEVIGRRFGFGAVPDKQDWTIVGVVGDVTVNSVRDGPPPMFFTPVAQLQFSFQSLHFLAVRATGPVDVVETRLRQELAHEEPALVWTGWQTLQERMEQDVRGDVAISWMVGGLAVVGMTLATLGIGVNLAHLVELHRRDIAIRMALGAAQRRVVREVLVGAWRMAALGGIAGLVLVWLLPHVPVAGSMLPARPDVWAALAALILGLMAATFGGWRPARRAASVDPQRLLRAE